MKSQILNQNLNFLALQRKRMEIPSSPLNIFSFSIKSDDQVNMTDKRSYRAQEFTLLH